MARNSLWELNEYGIIYHRQWMIPGPLGNDGTNWNEYNQEENYLNADYIIQTVCVLIYEAMKFYDKCQYRGNIEFVAQTRQVYGYKMLMSNVPVILDPRLQVSVEPEISACAQCVPRSLQKAEEYTRVLFELIDRMFWAFNIPVNELSSLHEKWRQIVERDFVKIRG